MKTFKEYITENKNHILYIVRGIPGSGKSYTINQMLPKEHIFSTDSFWGPNYNFKRELIGKAHNWNQDRVAQAMKDGKTPIGVDNTNVTWRDISPYVQMANKFGYDIKYIESQSPWWLEFKSNIRNPEFKDGDLKFEETVKFYTKKNCHGVPEGAIRAMINRWQPMEKLPI